MMNSIRINIYYKNRSVLAESFTISIGDEVKNIDDAKILVIQNIDKFYSDTKYKINLFKGFEGESEINIDFEEENISLSREFKLREILK